MSRKSPLIVGWHSKDKFMTVDNNCEIHELPGRKPNWHFVKDWFWWKLLKSSLKMILSYNLPKIGRRLIGLKI